MSTPNVGDAGPPDDDMDKGEAVDVAAKPDQIVTNSNKSPIPVNPLHHQVTIESKEEPPQSDHGTGPGKRPQRIEENAEMPPLLFDEIRRMQEKLRLLEEQALRKWNLGLGAPSSPGDDACMTGVDTGIGQRQADRELLDTTEAASSKRWVRRAETQAEETSDERKD